MTKERTVTLSVAPPNHNGALNTDFKTVQVPPDILKDKARQHNYSPIVWKDGIRSGDNFLYADIIPIDVDEGKPLIDDAVSSVRVTEKHYADLLDRNLREGVRTLDSN